MTKEQIESRINEELEDALRYEKMAEECRDYSSIFYDIANEERSHARLLRHIHDHME